MRLPKKTVSEYPDIMKEWDQKKNGGLNPDKLSDGSHTKAYWICSTCGYSWKSEIRTRCIFGNGCKKCGIKKCQESRKEHYQQKNGTVSSVCPELLDEWDYKKNGDIKPEELNIGSSEEVWWICKKCGNSWHTRVYQRAKMGTGCRKCASKINGKELTKRMIKERGSLLDNHPELAEEWDYEKNGNIKPEDVMSYSNINYWWKCPFGHDSYQATPNNRLKPSGCPACKKDKQTSIPEKIIYYYISKIFPSTQQNYRPLFLDGMELDVYIPDIRLAIEYDGEAWHKKTDKDIRKSELCSRNGIKLIRFREPKCPPLDDQSICYKLDKNINDNNNFIEPIKWLLQTINNDYKYNIDIDVDIERDYIEILNLIEVGIKDNSIGKALPEVCSEWDLEKMGEITPFQISAHSRKPIWLICPICGNSYKTTAMQRMKSDRCSDCSYNKRAATRQQKLIQKNGSLLDNFPNIAKEWDQELNGDLKPSDIVAGSHKRVHWVCSICGHRWVNNPDNRTRHGQNCPECGKKKCVQTRKENRDLYSD